MRHEITKKRKRHRNSWKIQKIMVDIKSKELILLCNMITEIFIYYLKDSSLRLFWEDIPDYR